MASRRESRVGRTAEDALALAVVLGVYLALAVPRAAENVYPVGDQARYLFHAVHVRQTGRLPAGFSYLYADRGWTHPAANAGPLLQYLLAPLAGRDVNFFLRARLAVIALSGLGLVLLFAAARPLGLVAATAGCVALAVTRSFAELAGTVVPDAPLAACLGAVACWLIGVRADKLRPWLMARVGWATGVLWMLKPTAMAVAVGAAAAAAGCGRLRRVALLWAALVAGFCLGGAPWLVRNAVLFGNPLYHDTTTHFVWLDHWRERGGGAHYPYTDATRPTLGRFIQRHGVEGLVRRVLRGVRPALMSLRRATVPVGLGQGRPVEWGCFLVWLGLVVVGVRWGSPSAGVWAVGVASGFILASLACFGTVTSFHYRFTLPIVGMAAPFVGMAIQRIGRVARKRVASRAAVLGTLAAVAWLSFAARLPAAVAGLAQPPPFRDAEVIAFLRGLEPGARVAVASHIGCWAFSYDHPFVIVPNVGSIEEMTALLDRIGVRYLVVEPGAWSERYRWFGRLPSEADGWKLLRRFDLRDRRRTVIVYQRGHRRAHHHGALTPTPCRRLAKEKVAKQRTPAATRTMGQGSDRSCDDEVRRMQ